jgi:transcriptional regulator with XRE-family HTH domain
MSSIGKKLKALRKARNMTQEELAKFSGISRGYIANIESGTKIEVANEKIHALAKALRINPDYFKITGAELPMSALPNLPADIIELVSDADSMPYLKLTQKARENGVTPAQMEAVINLILATMKMKK